MFSVCPWAGTWIVFFMRDWRMKGIKQAVASHEKLLLLSQGQAAVERGFSSNRQIDVENLSENGYKAQRLINDHLRAVGGIKEVVIDKTLLTSVSMTSTISDLPWGTEKIETKFWGMQEDKIFWEWIEWSFNKSKTIGHGHEGSGRLCRWYL